MTAKGRHEDLLWGLGVSYPTPVTRHVLVEDGFLVEEALDEDFARRDDAHWARFAKRLWVTPQGFINWWVNRRWVMPRDIRRR